ncbi:hypothetical protein OAO01_03010 [Oligoflexia bacterium]|nr:hypothetical protein [Oligoflexia bacterium]
MERLGQETIFNEMKKLLTCLIILVILVLPLYVRALYESAHYLKAGRDSAAQAQWQAAVVSLRKAAAWSAPLNCFAKDARELLFQLSTAPEHDEAFRLEALRELKRGIMTSRNGFTWGRLVAAKGWLTKVDRELVKLLPKEQQEHQINAVHPPHVNFGFQLLAQCMFWCWIASVAYLIFWGFAKDGTIKRAPLYRGLMLTGIFYTLWLVTLSYA